MIALVEAIQNIINEINKKNNILEEINKELIEIEKKEVLISKYEKALTCVDHLKKNFKYIIPSILGMGAFSIVNELNIVVGILLTLAFGVFIGAILLGKDFIKAIQAKKIIKEIQEEYKSAKESEEKDKDLKLFLKDERIKINDKIFFLNMTLDYLKQVETKQDLSNQSLEQVLNNIQSQIVENEERPEIDTTQTFGKIYPSLN